MADPAKTVEPPAYFTPEEKKSIIEVLSNPMACEEIRAMDPFAYQNFLYMPLPMLRTQKEKQLIFQNFKSIILGLSASLFVSTFISIQATRYIMSYSRFVRYPIRTAIYGIPMAAAYHFVIQPAFDELLKVHMRIAKRLMRYSYKGNPKDFFL